MSTYNDPMGQLLRALPPFVGTLAALMPLLVTDPPLRVPKSLRVPLGTLILVYIWLGYLVAQWFGPRFFYYPATTFLVLMAGVLTLLAVILNAVRTRMAPSNVNTVAYVVAVGFLTTGFSLSLPEDRSRVIVVVKDPSVTQLAVRLDAGDVPWPLVLRNGLLGERGVFLDWTQLPGANDRKTLRLVVRRGPGEEKEWRLGQLPFERRGRVAAFEIEASP